LTATRQVKQFAPEPTGQGPATAKLSYREVLLTQSAQDGLRKGARTEMRIRWAACELLEECSLSDLKVADICTRLEIAQGTFYQYFVDRDTLLSSLLESFVHFLSANMAAAAKGGRTYEETTRETTRIYCQLFVQNRGLMKCLLNHYESFPQARKILQEFNTNWIETVVKSIKRRRGSRRSGHASDAELRRRCYALGGMVDQYLSYIYLQGDQDVTAVAGDIDTIVDTLDYIWWQSFKKEIGHAG